MKYTKKEGVAYQLDDEYEDRNQEKEFKVVGKFMEHFMRDGGPDNDPEKGAYENA
jgi:hypothetical protein